MNEPVTPMMKQYFEIKSQYEDCILFYRLGDFYEMFYDDAIKASKILEISLTGRNCGQEERAPMCGVPYHSAENYIAKLIKNGLKVAVCEQVEDPKSAKGIVKRDIIRVITPGTANLDAVLTSGENNFLACVYMNGDSYAVSLCDVSTGELVVNEGENTVAENQLLNVIACFEPSELIVNDGAHAKAKMFTAFKKRFDFYSSFIEEEYFDLGEAKKAVYGKFESLKDNDILKDKENSVRSLGALLKYLKETQKTDLSHVREIKVYRTCDYMEIDLASRRNLELTETIRDKSKKGSLYSILDKTKTAMGARRLKSWIDRPLVSVSAINMRLEAVDELIRNAPVREEITEVLKRINDIERIVGKVVYGTCNARDFLSLRKSLEVLPELKKVLAECKCSLLEHLSAGLDEMRDICTLLKNSIKDDDLPFSVREGGMIKEGFDKELDRLTDIVNNGADIIARMEADEKEKTGIKTLKISYNKVFGYYIEVSKMQTNLVPDSYVRKQTLANCERYITQELKELENTILGARERINNLQYEDFMYIRSEINKSSERLQTSAEAVSNTDVLCSFATVASSNGYTRPEVNDGDEIVIHGGRHPIVETALSDTLFVPNDTYLNTTDSRFSIITGPNMAGKSTYMRQTALIVLMAQIGSFVPAQSSKIGITDRIFTRIGASDDLASGQSTFMVEMNEVANILKNATGKSLLILDEIGRGTSTFDGLSIAWAVVEYICKNIGARSLFATHYHELTVLEGKVDGVKNFSVAVKRHGDSITFLRKIVKGGTDDSYGIEVAKLAGVPGEVTSRAKEVLASVEGGKSPIDGGEKIQANIETNRAEAESEKKIKDFILSLDVTTLTPLEALNELYKLQQKVNSDDQN